MNISVSIGELVDKVSILSIKLDRIKDAKKRKNIRKEYLLLVKSMESTGVRPSSPDFGLLQTINAKLWDIENRLRAKEHKKEFDDEFIQLARSVYIENDKRAAVKKKINLEYNSDLVEEKEYVDYA